MRVRWRGSGLSVVVPLKRSSPVCLQPVEGEILKAVGPRKPLLVHFALDVAVERSLGGLVYLSSCFGLELMHV